jgi:uncharacterized membrane protein YfcA
VDIFSGLICGGLPLFFSWTWRSEWIPAICILLHSYGVYWGLSGDIAGIVQEYSGSVPADRYHADFNLPIVVALLAGAVVGSFSGSFKFSEGILKYVITLVLVIANVKLYLV